MSLTVEALAGAVSLVLAVLGHALYTGRRLGRIETLLTELLMPEVKSLRETRHEHANQLTAHEGRLAQLERLHEREGSL